MTDELAHELLEINGIGEATLNKLMSGGIDTIVGLSEAAIEYIAGLDFTEATATDLIAKAVEHLVAEATGEEKSKEAEEAEDKPEKDKKGITAKIKSALSSGGSVAPTEVPSIIRMRTKRHRAPRHRKR